MKIIVFGANGLLARNLVDQLSQHHQVIAVINHGRTPKFSRSKGVEIIHNDLANIDLSTLPSDIEAIYYLAQSNRFREFPEGVDDMTKVNITTPLQIVQWAQKNSVRKFVYASSGGVYTEEYNQINEISDININKVLGFYLNSKLSAEMLLSNFASAFDCFTIIRPFFIYGENQSADMLIPRLINNIHSGKPIHLSGDNGLQINPIYVEDAVHACTKILDLSGKYIFNLAGEQALHLKQLCQLIAEILNKEVHFVKENTKQKDLVADISWMKKYLHTPTHSLENSLRKTIRSLRL